MNTNNQNLTKSNEEHVNLDPSGDDKQGIHNDGTMKKVDPRGDNEQGVDNSGPTGQSVNNDEMIDTINQMSGFNEEHG